MPRGLRIEFEEAIDHVMARRDARQKIVRDDADRRRLIHGVEQTVVRSRWESLCDVVSWPSGWALRGAIARNLTRGPEAPKTIDLIIQEGNDKAKAAPRIYGFSEGQLRLRINIFGGPSYLPSELKAQDRYGAGIAVLERVKDK
jgi:hypothetical protein